MLKLDAPDNAVTDVCAHGVRLLMRIDRNPISA